MANAAQFAANQANAQHSTGPLTDQGKAASARNRLNHGFRSSTVLLPGDDRAEYEELLAELSEHFGPADLTEERLTREMADAEWRLRRVRLHMESAISRHMSKLAAENPDLNPLDLQSLAVETLGQTGGSHSTCSYSTWLRYETKFERQYDRAYATWTRYQNHQRRASAQKVEPSQPGFTAPSAAAAPPASDLASNVQNVSHQQHPAQPAAPFVAPLVPYSPGSGQNSVPA